MPDGSAVTLDNGLSVTLTGGDNGSGDPNDSGTTDFFITAAAGGLVQFQYIYSSLDYPGYDYAGYFVGNTFYQLADIDGQSSLGVPITFTVSAGEVFGFRVGTLDNQGGPGILTISDFSAPAAPSVPEPGTASMVLLAATGAVIAAKRQRSRTDRGKKGIA